MPWDNDPAARRKSNATYNAEYKRKRLAALRRANWRCERRLPGCQGAASQTNHRGQAANDPHHDDLEAICDHCHRIVTANQGNAAKRGGDDPEPRSRTNW